MPPLSRAVIGSQTFWAERATPVSLHLEIIGRSLSYRTMVLFAFVISYWEIVTKAHAIRRANDAIAPDLCTRDPNVP